jgi:hypothetical protein
MPERFYKNWQIVITLHSVLVTLHRLCAISIKQQNYNWWHWSNTIFRATLHLEAGLIRCLGGLKSSLVIGQKAQIGPNPFTPRGRADSVVWFFLIIKCMLWHSPSSLNWVHPKWRADSWPRGQYHICFTLHITPNVVFTFCHGRFP